VNLLPHPRPSTSADDALSPTYTSSRGSRSFDQRLNAPRKDAEALAEQSTAGSRGQQQVFRQYQFSYPTRIQPPYYTSSPSLSDPLSHGNSDPFSALALSYPSGPTINQIITWHRQVQIPGAYPYALQAQFLNSKSMQRSCKTQ